MTGKFRGYCFIEYSNQFDCETAYRRSFNCYFDNTLILVDYERDRIMQGWVPRRFGGGLGGKRESGQLRFGSRRRPFKLSYSAQTNNESDSKWRSLGRSN